MTSHQASIPFLAVAHWESTGRCTGPITVPYYKCTFTVLPSNSSSVSHVFTCGFLPLCDLWVCVQWTEVWTLQPLYKVHGWRHQRAAERRARALETLHRTSVHTFKVIPCTCTQNTYSCDWVVMCSSVFNQRFLKSMSASAKPSETCQLYSSPANIQVSEGGVWGWRREDGR